jgi:hypothetical protein
MSLDLEILCFVLVSENAQMNVVVFGIDACNEDVSIVEPTWPELAAVRH